MGLAASAFLKPVICQFWAEADTATNNNNPPIKRFIPFRFSRLNYEKRTKGIGNIVQEKWTIL
jgi:hypothetical protein